MTMNQIICRAASAYPSALVMEYWDQEREQPRDNFRPDDSLAEFIANELYDSYDEDASDEEQVATAVAKIQSAADDLQAVAHALANIDREREREWECEVA